jgi:hypothetical protein
LNALIYYYILLALRFQGFFIFFNGLHILYAHLYPWNIWAPRSAIKKNPEEEGRAFLPGKY